MHVGDTKWDSCHPELYAQKIKQLFQQSFQTLKTIKLLLKIEEQIVERNLFSFQSVSYLLTLQFYKKLYHLSVLQNTSPVIAYRTAW